MKLFKQCPRVIPVLLLLAAFGLAREPIEKVAYTKLIDSRMLIPPPGVSARENLSQSVIMGLLGGLRGLISFGFRMHAYDNFGAKAWDDLRNDYQIITTLEPTEEENWVSAIWHLGINATANMQNDESLPRFERERRFNEYALQAIEFGERGWEQNPNSWRILKQLAEVYREKLRDDCGTAQVYGDAMKIEGAPSYMRRFHGYYRARCPGNEQEDYEFLMKLYREGPHQRLPTLIVEIKKLEKALDIPFPARIPDPDPDKRPIIRSKRERNSLPGRVSLPQP